MEVTAGSAPAATAPSSDSSDTSSESPDQSSGQGKPQADEPWRKVKHRMKSAGEIEEIEYDELVKRAEKYQGSEKRLAEATRKEKAAETEMKRLQKLRDPKDEDFNELIELMGFEKAKKFADRLVWDQIQWDELSDVDKKRILAEQERDALKSDLDKRKADDQRKEQERLFSEADRVITEEVTRVLADAKKQGLSVADLPEAKDLIIDEMLAYISYMDDMEAKGLPIKTPPPSHEDVLRKIQERFDTSSSAYIKRLSVEKIMSLLTKEQLQGLRQAEIDQLYAPIPGMTQGRSKTKEEITDDAPRRKGEKPKMKTDDFFAKMDKRFGG
jgi:hypothetical protein